MSDIKITNISINNSMIQITAEPTPTFNSCSDIISSSDSLLDVLSIVSDASDEDDIRELILPKYMELYPDVEFTDEIKHLIVAYTKHRDEENISRTELLLPHPYVLFIIHNLTIVNGAIGHFGLTPTNEDDSGTIPEIPDLIYNTIDWTDINKNSANMQFQCVNSQGGCGSCWAHAVTECITMRLAIKENYYLPLDITQLLGCDIGYGDNGCDGGLMINAINWISVNNLSGPTCTNITYSEYISSDNCCLCTDDLNNCPSADYTITCDSIVYKKSITKNQVIYALRDGPITIAIYASYEAFYNYKDGILNWVPSYQDIITHAVLLIGYIKCGNKEYWKIQNSWGTGWGKNGYYYAAAKDGNGDFDNPEYDKEYPIRYATYCTPSLVGDIKNKELYVIPSGIVGDITNEDQSETDNLICSNNNSI